MLDLHRMAILHQFSRSGSITATAEAMGYSASAISQQLTTLERETGAVLLERTARSATLTDAGRLLARHARTLLADSELAEGALAAQLGRIRGDLVITTIPSLAAPVAAAVVAIMREHPDVDIVMRQTASEPAAVAVAEHLADIAVTDDWKPRASPAPEGLTRRKVYTEAVVLAVHAEHPLAVLVAGLGRPLTARELAAAVPAMTWLCAPRGHPSRVAGDRRLADLSVRPRRRWELEGLRTIAELVASGTGCALLPETVASTQPADQLVRLRLTPALARHIFTLTRASTTTSPTVAACVAEITHQLRTASAPSPAPVS